MLYYTTLSRYANLTNNSDFYKQANIIGKAWRLLKKPFSKALPTVEKITGDAAKTESGKLWNTFAGVRNKVNNFVHEYGKDNTLRGLIKREFSPRGLLTNWGMMGAFNTGFAMLDPEEYGIDPNAGFFKRLGSAVGHGFFSGDTLKDTLYFSAGTIAARGAARYGGKILQGTGRLLQPKNPTGFWGRIFHTAGSTLTGAGTAMRIFDPGYLNALRVTGRLSGTSTLGMMKDVILNKQWGQQVKRVHNMLNSGKLFKHIDTGEIHNLANELLQLRGIKPNSNMAKEIHNILRPTDFFTRELERQGLKGKELLQTRNKMLGELGKDTSKIYHIGPEEVFKRLTKETVPFFNTNNAAALATQRLIAKPVAGITALAAPFWLDMQGYNWVTNRMEEPNSYKNQYNLLQKFNNRQYNMFRFNNNRMF